MQCLKWKQLTDDGSGGRVEYKIKFKISCHDFNGLSEAFNDGCTDSLPILKCQKDFLCSMFNAMHNKVDTKITITLHVLAMRVEAYLYNRQKITYECLDGLKSSYNMVVVIQSVDKRK